MSTTDNFEQQLRKRMMPVNQECPIIRRLLAKRRTAKGAREIKRKANKRRWERSHGESKNRLSIAHQ